MSTTNNNPGLNKLVAQGMKQRIPIWPLVLFGTGLASLATIWESIFTVNGGYRAIVFNKIWGTRNHVFDEGTKLKIPFIEDPVFFDIRAKPVNIHSPTGSKDLQMILVSLRILSRPNPAQLPTIYRTLGPDYSERVLPSIVNEVSKAVVAQYTASELLTRRDEVSNGIKSALISRAHEFHIIIDEVNLTDLGFGKEFRAAVEAKKVAQQEAERAKFLVDRALQDKRSAIIKALGEAQSIELLGKAVQTNPNFLRLRRLEAVREIADTLSSSKNRVMLNSSTLMFDSLGEKMHDIQAQNSVQDNSSEFSSLFNNLKSEYAYLPEEDEEISRSDILKLRKATRDQGDLSASELQLFGQQARPTTRLPVIPTAND
eukprot:TRINITY_DN8275_c0_g2_i1.p1 TRINITY_DN8275_c0_g2~~TRINITY_DN8275_c0_g2_i1.p1  ORF type:complete len:372 (-),score=75.80 TRINITY_DN8275_c0_g2_i1:67-1182(-)